MRFSVDIEREQDGRWIAEVPDCGVFNLGAGSSDCLVWSILGMKAL